MWSKKSELENRILELEKDVRTLAMACGYSSASPVHFVTVAELRTLISELRETDRLYPNVIHNLAVVRDGTYIGLINCARTAGNPAINLVPRDGLVFEREGIERG